jgi:protein-S-isoprenylcysteine O-methyltransferase Ste14
VPESQWHTLAAVANAVCWGVVIAVWVAGAIYNERRAPRVRKRAARIVPWAFVVVLVLALLANAVPRADWRALTVHSGWLRAPGLAVLVFSTVFTLWARAVLGTMWTGRPALKEDHALRTDGPYAITRHPIYTGLIGMLLGTTLLAGLGSSLILLAIVTAGLELKIRTEERLLLEAFPGSYEQYRQRVPRLVPGIRLPGRSRPRSSR